MLEALIIIITALSVGAENEPSISTTTSSSDGAVLSCAPDVSVTPIPFGHKVEINPCVPSFKEGSEDATLGDASPVVPPEASEAQETAVEEADVRCEIAKNAHNGGVEYIATLIGGSTPSQGDYEFAITSEGQNQLNLKQGWTFDLAPAERLEVGRQLVAVGPNTELTAALQVNGAPLDCTSP